MTNRSNDSRPTINISSSMEYLDCEDCGGYESGSVHIDLPDGRSLDADYDGHFGGGCWDGKLESVYFWCLQALGVELRVNGEEVDDHRYRVAVPKSGGEWEDVNLYPEHREVVDLTLVTQERSEFPNYPEPVSISWRKKDGTQEDILANLTDFTAESWNGEISQLYIRVLQERAIVVES